MTEHKKVIMPNFFIVGAAKCGTTTLYEYLRMHPGVFMSRLKEPAFFAADSMLKRRNGIKDTKRKIVTEFESYSKLFEDSCGRPVIGEASTDYLYYHAEAIPKMKRYLGNPKIIIMLRNPVERAYSAYMHLVRDNREFLPFEEALTSEGSRMKEGWSSSWYYTAKGYYCDQVRAYLEHFAEVKVCLFDDLQKNPVVLAQEVYDFLGVDATFVPSIGTKYNVSGVPRFKRINAFFIEPSWLQSLTKGIGKFILKEEGWVKLRDTTRAKILTKVEMTPETRQYLEGQYHDEIIRLQTLIRRDLTSWLGA
ncbi:MAG: sulfotransferase [Candidatus Abyssobacteria bacterium SURF_17]|uniref:Sulfotransferase n=1 Tax=Candidatus Abyssobacteria bacterium SURF_17 TaxID=2093361 RepID=A0A419EW05_9BACT|nr:MAG: sulfotransferase [Candidatus Abyssubacteria bacterium SURF_17]